MNINQLEPKSYTEISKLNINQLPSNSVFNVIQNENIKQSYFQRLKQDFQTRQQEVQSIKNSGASLPERVLQNAGQVAGGVFDIVGEAPVIKQGLDLAGKGIQKLSETKPIQKVGEIISPLTEKALNTWNSLPDNVKKDIEAGINIASILPIGEGAKIATSKIAPLAGETLTKAGSAIEKAGIKTIESQKQSFVRDLIRPEQTKAIKEAQVARTTEKGSGLLKRSVIAPTPQELKAEQAVASISEVSSKNTFQQNYNVIKNVNQQEAISLEKAISENDFIIPKKEIKAKLAQASSSLSESPLITGDAEIMAQKLITKANQIIDANEGTGSGLLKARKEYDAWVMSQKPKAFDATAENAFTLANREVRNTLNTLLDENATNVSVKESLSKQSSLYRALDNIEPKAAAEADTAIGRVFNNMAKAVGIKNKVVQQVAALVGIGGLGAAATFAPVALGVGGLGFLGYQGAKLVMKPELRIALGKLLKQSGHLLNPEDKTILENAIKTYTETPNKEEGFISLPQEKPTTNGVSPKVLKSEIPKSSPKSTTSSLKVKGEIPKQPQPLAQEARKYKSAEDFVKAIDTQGDKSFIEPNVGLKTTTGQPIIMKGYHGTTKSFDKFTIPEKGVRYTGNGVYFYPSKTSAEGFVHGKQGGKVIESYLDLKNPYTMYLPEGNIDFQPGKEIIDSIKNKGYDAIIVRTGKNSPGDDMINEVVVFDTNTIKTKSQLTDIWNKANKK